MVKLLIPCNLSVYEYDMYIKRIKDKIKEKQNLLLLKRNYLNQIYKTNKYLETIKNDYDIYYNYIIQQKKEQYEAMLRLKKHINDIIINGGLTDEDILEAKNEQNKIIKQIDEIKNELDILMNIK